MQVLAAELDHLTERFMAEHGLEDAWRIVQRLVRESFPGLRDLRARFASDPEIPNEEHIRVEALVSGGIDEILSCQDRFFEAFHREIGQQAREFFVLTVDVVD